MKVRKLAIFSVAPIATACGFLVDNVGKPKPDDEPKTNTIVCEAKDLPAVTPAAGLFTFSLAENIDPCSVSGYIVGYADVLKVELAQDGTYFINNVPAGTHDVIVTGQDLSAPAALVDQEHINAVRLSNVEFLNGVKADKGRVELPPAGAASGKAVLFGQTVHSGIHVYIPGTGFDATTDDQGRYSIASVPVGVNNFYFEKDGYHLGQVESIDVPSKETVPLPDIELVLSTGAEGFLIIARDAGSFASRTVPLTIGATNDAVLMKVSESDAFNGTSWKPVASSSTYTFATQGAKTLYVKFADANGLESSPFDDSVTIELFPASAVGFELQTSTIESPLAPEFQLAISMNENAKQMIVSSASNFAGGSWIDVASSLTFPFAKDNSSCGQKTIYLKFRDADGFESEVFSQNVTLKCSWAVNPNGAYDRYSWGSGAITASAGEVVIWGGGNGATCNRDGAIYSVADDTWTAIPDAPQGAWDTTGVWTNNKLYVFGGHNCANGFVGLQTFDSATGLWSSDQGTNHPSVTAGAVSVWTGAEFVVFGGFSAADLSSRHSQGYAFNPQTNTWRTISQSPIVNDFPGKYFFHEVVWSGAEMFLYTTKICVPGSCASGGYTVPLYAWNPSNDTWRRVADSGGDWSSIFFHDGRILSRNRARYLDLSTLETRTFHELGWDMGWGQLGVVAGRFLYDHQQLRLIEIDAFN